MHCRVGEVRSQLLEKSPTEFETFVATLWENQGWVTSVTTASNDAGVDIIAERSGLHDEKAAIQAKKYAVSNKIGRPDIQQYDTLRRQDPDVDFVIIVTTSGFTQQAEQLASQLNVKLVNGEALAEAALDSLAESQLATLLGTAPQDDNTESTPEQGGSSSPTEPEEQPDPEELSASELADSLSSELTEDDLTEKEAQLANLYEWYWDQRNTDFNGNAGSSLVFEFDAVDNLEVYQFLVGLHSIEFTDTKRAREARKTAQQYNWDIDNWEPNRRAGALLNLKPNGNIGEKFDPAFEARFTRIVFEGFLDTDLHTVRLIKQNPFDGKTEARTLNLSEFE
ncbi:hypothetical protein J2752_002611 [Halarchaeum rubridurum]|uniref:Restriction endonuclease type IV Mrr domain-containing protein n=1 Tax=Halarchaeum rubridurum TaxID=489911 RepID=A0A830G400_9EURY|nr:restriction endonuclease [Halarchaeum rubridurum]MBP1955682.1 hypothetical protein [Halarchaeum rubridurum]GGM74197.1 hypothetical protein GCM10009017_25230 [Halarchaeum rubridurum]